MKKLFAAVLILGLCVQGYADTIAAYTNIANGDTSDAPTLMTNLNLVRDECNGNLNNDNIKAAAGIIESKLNLNALAITNLVKNATFESWATGTTSQPNDWVTVLTPTVARGTAQQGYGSYCLQLTGAGASDEGSKQTLTNLKISTTYRVSARVKVTSGDTASITTTGATTNMDEDSTSASWTTVTGYFTTDGSGTDVVLQLLAQNTTDVASFDNICVTEGTARVGWVPRHDYHTSGITLTSNATFAGATTVNHIKFPDNLADALSLEDATGNVYAKIVSTTGSLGVTLGQDVTISDGMSLDIYEDITWNGATTENLLLIPDNLADALSLKNANGDVFAKIISTTGSLGLQFGQNVGIGAAPDANYALYVADDIASYSAGKFFNDGNNINRYGVEIQCGADDQSASTSLFIVGRDGDGEAVGYLQHASGTFEVGQTSDRKRKQDIVDTAMKGKGSIMALKVRDFKWKKNPNKLITGFIAQEVATVVPAAITTSPIDGTLVFAPTRLIAPMIKHMQEMQKKIEELEARIKALEAP